MERFRGGEATRELRPSTMTGVLDAGFGLLRAEPVKLLQLGAVAALPPLVVVLALVEPAAFRDFLESSTVGTAQGSSAEFDGRTLAASYLSLAVSSWLLGLVTLAVGHIATARLSGRAVSTGEALGRSLRRFWPLTLAWVVVKLLELVGLLGFGVGALVMMTFCAVVVPALGIESLSAFGAIGRSFRLVASRFWFVLGVVVLVAVVDTAVSYVLTAPFVALGVWQQNLAGLAVAAVGTALVDMITVPFVAGAAVYLHLELRVRREGLDLVMEAQRLLGVRAT